MLEYSRRPSVRRGLHQSGYVIWFTALFPYVVMITLLVKALTLDGAIDGLQAYVHVRKDRTPELNTPLYSVLNLIQAWM